MCSCGDYGLSGKARSRNLLGDFTGIWKETVKGWHSDAIVLYILRMNETSKFFPAHRDVWAHGQVKSKIWLCEHLEKAQAELEPLKPWTIWIYGGWYSMTAFLLLSRDRLQIHHIRGLDLDPDATKAADIINDRWVYDSWKFKAFVKDCNSVDFKEDSLRMDSQPPDLIVNTACEHFISGKWWEDLPAGQLVALQSNDMIHEEHIDNSGSLMEFVERHPLAEIYFRGEIRFDYREDFKFNRFMLIGRK